jgi:hypothetical protein
VAAWLSESGGCGVYLIELSAVPEDEMCKHQPRCPDALAPDCKAARVTVSHPEQGWSLLCNGVVLFDDAGALLPSGREVCSPGTVPAVTYAAPTRPALAAVAA